MNRRYTLPSLAGVALALGACSSPDLSGPCPVPPGATEAQRQEAYRQCYAKMSDNYVSTRLKKDVDILFVIDNSTSMSPKQKVLGDNIPKFIAKIDATGANYHVGVVTTDIGTLTAPNTPFPGSADTRCSTFEGDDGVLQNTVCTNRQGVSAETTTACGVLCPDPKFAPLAGARFISKDENGINVPSAKDGMGNEVGPQKAFQCIAMIGDAGCGIESPLEAARRALDGHRQENANFLRADSVLAVVFITDEDDCSVQLAQRKNNNPSTPNASKPICSAPAGGDAPAECYGLDFRCLAKDVQCDQPLYQSGRKTNCKERTDSYLEPTEKYVKFFSQLRTPDKLVLAGIWTPTMLDNPTANAATPGSLVVAQDPQGSPDISGLNRAQKNDAGCYNPAVVTTDPKGFFGQAQLRLSSFIRRFAPDNYVEKSICDAANYPSALDLIAEKITNKLNANCLAVTPKVVNGTPLCVVGYVDSSTPNATPDVLLPQCSANCCKAWGSEKLANVANPNIVAACTPEAEDCYCATPSTAMNCVDTVVAGVWKKGGGMTPAGKVINFKCAGY